MRTSTIHFEIDLDEKNFPDKISWDATDKPEQGPSETKSISINLWDHAQNNTLRIDLWAKDMPVADMKKFYVDCIGGMAQSVLSSTGDELMAREMNALCEKLAKHIREEK